MSLSKHLDLGELATGTANYRGTHRYGIALIPHGNRSRDVQEYGVDYLEERVSIDKYTGLEERINSNISEIKESGSIIGFSY